MTSPAEPKPEMLAQLKAFLAEHPEVMSELAAAAEAALPPSLYEVVHTVVEMIRGIDDVRREELHAAIDRHQAEHDALVATVKPAVADPSEPEPAAADPTAAADAAAYGLQTPPA